MTGFYYNRKGGRIPLAEWARLHADDEYKQVARTEVADASVSTVWLGSDHGFGSQYPIIFETMVFGGEFDQEMRRYPSEHEARIGHEEMVRLVAEFARIEQEMIDGMISDIRAKYAPLAQ